MLQGYKLFDADAHTMMSPRMWETLPGEYRARRPRPTRVHDASDLGRWTNGWLVEGQIIPHALGAGSQPGNEPARVLEEFGDSSDLPHGEGRHDAAKEILGRQDISDLQKRKILYGNAVKFFGEP